MRTLTDAELNDVAGGTFGLISNLLSRLHGKSYGCAPKHEPKCPPPPKKGC